MYLKNLLSERNIPRIAPISTIFGPIESQHHEPFPEKKNERNKRKVFKKKFVVVAAIVDRFQEDENIPVFLISLKAGGTGLNLTGADVVVHFDPWWNPAAEAQATDRAHRIGQKKQVTVYKLITSGTVEEKVLDLQREKRKLLEQVFEESEVANLSLSVDDLRQLI